MKNYYSRYLFILLLSPIFSYSQKIAENKIDDFTKTSVIRTTWDNLYKGGLSNPFWISIRVSKLNSSYWIDIKTMNDNKVQSIQEGGKFLLMLTNDSIIELNNNKYVISCIGCGATGFIGSGGEGIETSFLLNDSLKGILQKIPLKKIRLYFTDGYVEGELKNKQTELILKDIYAVDNPHSIK
ncbi:MAG TPA: hypothetical protein VK705_09385 [Ferruginibacter sp.]|jgi:hypothetical protein|nr:hypothetical protein [Ferruginibacter sp.]